VILNYTLAALAFLSLAITLWQWLAARRFPLHRRVQDKSFAPAVTLLKPLKGCDEHTESCLRSWLAQDYAGDVQILFGVASADDPACDIANKLIREFPKLDARLVVCNERLGGNAKVSKLAQLEPQVKHDVIIVSDADVSAPPDLLSNAVAPLRDPGVGLVSCFYRLTGSVNAAMRWEAVAINADFWSQVLQAKSLEPLDFALGAVMVTRRNQLAEIGGFKALVDCLADDYQLGNRIARRGHRVELCPVVVECLAGPMNWTKVWRHQLRWARTIRVCRTVPYFFSILSNATLWPLVWLVVRPEAWSACAAAVCLLVRAVTAASLEVRLTQTPFAVSTLWLVPMKDLLQAALWACAFAGNRVEWRGERYRLRRDGTLEKD
jgi:ceramide glucosyltransferase